MNLHSSCVTPIRCLAGTALGLLICLSTTPAQSFSAAATASMNVAGLAWSGPVPYEPNYMHLANWPHPTVGATGHVSRTAERVSLLARASVDGTLTGTPYVSSVQASVVLQAPAGAGARVQILGSGNGVTMLVHANGQLIYTSPGSPPQFDLQVPPAGLHLTLDLIAAPPLIPGTLTQEAGTLDVSWSYPGVAPWGTPTPGCLGPAVCWTQGAPTLGNAGFGITCSNAHPFRGGVSVVGLGGLSTPIVYDAVDVWVDPNLPIATLYIPSNANGELFHPIPIPSHPSFLGLPLYCQWLLFEPTGCMPLDLSGSNAIHVTLIQ